MSKLSPKPAFIEQRRTQCDVAFTVRVWAAGRISRDAVGPIRLGIDAVVEMMRPAHSDTVHFKSLIDFDIDLLPILNVAAAYDRTG